MSESEAPGPGIEDGQVTELLERLHESPESIERLASLVYQDIHRLARNQRFRMGRSSTLRTTEVVNEAFAKVFLDSDARIKNRDHLMSLMTRVIRQVIVDHARKRLSHKRGSGAIHLPLDDDQLESTDQDAAAVLDMEQALQRVARIDPELADLVAAKFYAGFSSAELAEIRGSSPRTIQRELKRAVAWLRLEMGNSVGAEG